MRIAVAAPNLTPHDAVSNDAVGMYRTLRGAGYETALFSISGGSSVQYAARPFRELGWWLGENDLVIYHYCTADFAALHELRELDARIFIKYHNVTPSEFYIGWSVEHVRGTRMGRAMLHQIVDLPVELFMSDSTFNMEELLALGVAPARAVVVPPFNEVEALLEEDDDPATVAYLSRNSTNLLSIGRIVPNKGYEDMLAALAASSTSRTKRPHLHCVGSHDSRLAGYIDSLRTLVADLSLQGSVSFHPLVASAALASYLRHCDMYVTASHHEGFCVPVVEAMAFGLPVISSHRGALPETCAAAALYGSDPTEMGQAIAALMQSDEKRFGLQQAGLERYRTCFTAEAIEAQFLTHVRAAERAEVVPYDGVDDPLANDDGAFGLPGFQRLVADYCRHHVVPRYRMRSAIYRRNLVVTVLLHCSERELEDYFDNAEVEAYIDRLYMPRAAKHLPSIAKVFWHFSSHARRLFSLMDRSSVADFSEWFWRLASVNPALLALVEDRTKARLASLERLRSWTEVEPGAAIDDRRPAL